MYALLFAGTVIVSNQRTHSLDNPVCRKIQEGLELVIDTKGEAEWDVMPMRLQL